MNRPPVPLLLVLCAGLAGCGETARLAVADGTGPTPQL
ncbi:sorbosone dehydrogenase family protein, partial [Pseudomonas sp. S32]|nr:sorbosone dehydrogenase family protein [Pseudomonas sp. S32]